MSQEGNRAQNDVEGFLCSGIADEGEAMYSRIVVAVDGSYASGQALDEAIRLAMSSNASLCIVHVLDDLSVSLMANPFLGYCTGELIGNMRQEGSQILEHARLRATAAGLQANTVLYDNLGPAVEKRIVRIAQDWPADLIVMGTHGRRGVVRDVLGSSAESVLRTSPVPTLLVRAREGQRRPASCATRLEKQPVFSGGIPPSRQSWATTRRES